MNYFQLMAKAISSSIIPNLYELSELPFLKKELAPFRRFKDKEKYLSQLRSITYQAKDVMSKILLFELKEERLEKTIKRTLVLLTEKEIVSLAGLYQILNDSMSQKDFSIQVERIRHFQKSVYSHFNGQVGRDLITFGSEGYLTFNVYLKDEQFYIKASINHYAYRMFLDESPQMFDCPPPCKINCAIVKQQLKRRYNAIMNMLKSVVFDPEISTAYKNFYDSNYFHYDEEILKLQVFHNYPLLRMKNYVPVRFRDGRTGQPLDGTIFSNADQECMYGHFTGYNADSTKFIEGEACDICQVPVDQLQENQLLMMLRDNIANPEKQDIFYCPEFNRFKIFGKMAMSVESSEDKMNQQTVVYKTTLNYLNYYHFRLNLKKMTNKNRLNCYPIDIQQAFPLTFQFLDRTFLIMDPAKGRQCQHYSFTDLRLYYLSYDPKTNLYTCPIAGCGQKMVDADILYLKQNNILMQYVKFKSDGCSDLINLSKVVIDHKNKKYFIAYKYREENGLITSKLEQLTQYYKTMLDPYVPFAQYTLGIKDKEKEKKMNEYMFGGLRGEMEQQTIEQQDEEEIEQN